MTEYDAGYLVGVLFGVITAGAAVLLFLWFTRKERAKKNKYDERQTLVRGKGYQYAFTILFGYNIIYAVLGDYIEIAADRSVILFFGLILGALVYATYTIWNDGYFPLYEKPKGWIAVFVAIAVVNVIKGLRNVSYYGAVQDGIISDSIIDLMVSICILIILAALLLKYFVEKRKRQDEE